MGNTVMEKAGYLVFVNGVPCAGTGAFLEEIGIRVADENGNNRPEADILDEFDAALELRKEIRNVPAAVKSYAE